jgi:hypothetical protein
MKSFFIISIYALLSSVSIAMEPVQSVEKILQTAIDAGLPPDNPQCDLPDDSKRRCSDIADEICDKIWNSENKGNMDVADGKIALGDSKKSRMKQSQLINFRALVAAQDKLKDPFKSKLAPILDNLGKHLDGEEDTKSWFRELSKILSNYDYAKQDLASDLAETRHPELKKVKMDDLKLEQRGHYTQAGHDLQAMILDAKYKEHPHWKSVEEVFLNAKTDILTQIKKMNLPDEDKKMMIEKVKTVKLSLPYTDPNRLAADAECETSVHNAYYTGKFNTFTVCAGFLHALQSPSALYGTIAHEISHSIDPIRVADMKCQKHGRVNKGLRNLTGEKGLNISCKDWLDIANDVLKAPLPTKPIDLGPLQSLYDCLKDKEGLNAINQQVLLGSSMENAKTYAHFNASDGVFLQLIAESDVTKDGIIVPNEYYGRPDRVTSNIYYAGLKEKIPASGRDAYDTEIFSVVYRCLPEAKTEEQKKRNLDFAIQKTIQISQLQTAETNSYLGKNSKELVSGGYSRVSIEEFADWMAAQAYEQYLGRQKNRDATMNIIEMSNMALCQQPTMNDLYPQLAFIQKQYSFEEHPNDKLRRYAFFNNTNAKYADCEITAEEQGFGGCQL